MPTPRGSVPAGRTGIIAAAVLALLLAAASLPPAAAGGTFQTGPITLAVDGVDYAFTTAECAPVISCETMMQVSLVWGNEAFAQKMARALELKLGYEGVDDPKLGPVFPYQKFDTFYSSMQFVNSESYGQSMNAQGLAFNDPYTIGVVAFAPPSPSPEPSPSPNPEPSPSPSLEPSVSPSPSPSPSPSLEPGVSPSPSPMAAQPPVCTGRALNITNIDAKTNGQLCTLRKLATRKRNPVKVGKVATLVPFGDPQGNPASIIFTGATSNRMASASCPCSAAQRRAGNCTCAPAAVIAKDGASVRLMPLLRVNAMRKPAATTVRLFFTATVPATGLSCSGFVDVCSRRLMRSGAPVRGAPACSAFEATKVSHNLTACSG